MTQVFDGGSLVLKPHGVLTHQMPAFDPMFTHSGFRTGAGGMGRPCRAEKSALPDTWEGDYRVMVEALRDYFAKSGFSKAVLGLSGGIDSALVAAIAADALGPENLRCVMLPPRFTFESIARGCRRCRASPRHAARHRGRFGSRA